MKYLKSVLLIIICFLLITACGKKEEPQVIEETPKEENPVVEETKKLQIFDENSNSRPYAIMINNAIVAMKVQTGLNDAYMIYEFPIEGGMSRSVAFFKDKETEQVGTVRSARQYHPYYAIEHDAIYVHWGGNHPAYDTLNETKITHIDALSVSSPFFRKNPEKIATEHTGYASIKKLNSYVKSKNIKSTTDVKPPIKYSYDEIDLSTSNDAKVANSVEVYYSNSYKLKYTYSKDTKRYERSYNGKEHKDYNTKEIFDTKNLIIAFVKVGSLKDYQDAAGTNYLDFTVIGSGNGYYITNGYAREITWTKDTKTSQTVYKYTDGTEININDGNTYINYFDKSKSVAIK